MITPTTKDYEKMFSYETFLEAVNDRRIFRKDELFKILQDLVAVNTENPPGKEEAAARYIQDLLEKNGIESKLQWAGPERPNVIAKLKGGRAGSKIIYNGHLDVVPAGAGWTEAPFGGGCEK